MTNQHIRSLFQTMTRELAWAHEATQRAEDESTPEGASEQYDMALAQIGLLIQTATQAHDALKEKRRRKQLGINERARHSAA